MPYWNACTPRRLWLGTLMLVLTWRPATPCTSVLAPRTHPPTGSKLCSTLRTPFQSTLVSIPWCSLVPIPTVHKASLPYNPIWTLNNEIVALSMCSHANSWLFVGRYCSLIYIGCAPRKFLKLNCLRYNLVTSTCIWHGFIGCSIIVSCYSHLLEHNNNWQAGKFLIVLEK